MQIDRNALISQVTESCLQDGSCDRAGLQGNPAAPKKNPQHLKMHRLPVPGGLPSFTDSTPRWERRGPGLRSGPLGWGRLGAHAVRAQQAAAAKHPLICWATDLGTGASGDTACWRCSFHRHTLTPARLKESKIKGRWKQEKTRRVPPPPREAAGAICKAVTRSPACRACGRLRLQVALTRAGHSRAQPAQSAPSHAPCAAAARTRQVLPVPKEEMRAEAMAQTTSPGGTGPQAACSTQGPEALRKENRRLVPLTCRCVSKPALFKVTKARPNGVSWMRRAFGKQTRPRPGVGCGGSHDHPSSRAAGWRGLSEPSACPALGGEAVRTSLDPRGLTEPQDCPGGLRNGPLPDEERGSRGLTEE